MILLSATPVLRNEQGFLRMLHLLDPVVYDLNDEDTFRIKIQHRQVLAETVALLDPQNVLFLDGVLEDLLEKLPHDARLAELVKNLQQQLVGIPDEDDPEVHDAIHILKAHLSETYRLHRRILRNRRKTFDFLTPKRDGVQELIIPETWMHPLESALENWRIYAVYILDNPGDRKKTKELIDFYWNALESLVAHPSNLKGICEDRISSITQKTALCTFANEQDLLHEMMDCIDENAWYAARLEVLRQCLEKLLSLAKKVVVFCSEEGIADVVFNHLKKCKIKGIARHEVVEFDEYEETEQPWLQFQTGDTVNILVCDQTAEEGINLQGGNKVVIHFDELLSPNRMEQRMGRLDRFGSGKPIQSIVLLDGGSEFQKAWHHVLHSGFGVFNQSIASLQYLIEEQLNLLEDSIFQNGLEGLITFAKSLEGPQGIVAQEIKLIDHQDSLDELSQPSEEDTDDLDEVDSDWEAFEESFDQWVVRILLFSKYSEAFQPPHGGHHVNQQPVSVPFRFLYQKPEQEGKGQRTLISINMFLEDFFGAIDFEAPGANAKRPPSHVYSYFRNTAVRRRVRLLRYGDSFVESVKSFTDHDDRGRSFALWRQLSDSFDPQLQTLDGFEQQGFALFFRFDFLIESKLDSVYSVLKSQKHNTQASRSALKRRGDALFPPTVVHLWLDEEGNVPDSELIETCLDQPYSKNKDSNDYHDTNLNPNRFSSLIRSTPDFFDNWNLRCHRMREKALSILVNQQDLQDSQRDAIKNAKIQDEIRYAQLSTRIQHLTGKEADNEQKQLIFEKKLNEALYDGIQDPMIHLDVVGVVFLTNKPLGSVINAMDGEE
ncbi:MAG: SWF/SNF helicase family protein [SAR324 cluster bacterium]|nr:SWF/SNF helicase family protein [SAR324 cluster bacterium]